MYCMKKEFDDLSILEDMKKGRKMEKRKKMDVKNEEEDDDKYKSKNLKAERRRREKLNDRQLELRALVPNITNMSKPTIITDAITYIEGLQKNVKDLSDQLLKMETTFEKKEQEEISSKAEMKYFGIIPEVQIIDIGGNKLWIKILFEKMRGGITRLIEAMNELGFDIIDTSVTTTRGVVLVTSSVEGIRGGKHDATQIQEFLLEIINSNRTRRISV